jgi:phenylacetate-CoA ligase
VTDWKLKLYHRLPLPARSLAASLRGWQLRRWRYGDETQRLVAEALEREQWTPRQWEAWREERLAFILHRAATQVPYYRQQWSERRGRGDQASWEMLENWPILEKEPLRQHGPSFVADDCNPRQMFHDHTSGTSGKSLDLWYTRKTVRQWYALSEARWRRWYGVSMDNRWGILGGQLVTPAEQRQPPFWVWNSALNQLYLSSYHLAPDLIPRYLDAIADYKLTYLLGYTSSLHSLAQIALKLNRRDVKLKVAIANAEPVFDYQRNAIEEAFQCPLRETYGMAETTAAASQCEAGNLHLWPEAGWIEVINGHTPAKTGEAGDLVCTGLLNGDMPLIRYRIGDRAALADPEQPCRCGRRLPRLSSLEGRIDDVLYTPDGRRIGRLDPIFKAQLPVQEAQIIQERVDQVRVRYVPDAGFDNQAKLSIIKRLQERMGNVEVLLEPVTQIPRTANGKFRAVLCQIPPEQLKEWRQDAHNGI